MGRDVGMLGGGLVMCVGWICGYVGRWVCGELGKWVWF